MATIRPGKGEKITNTGELGAGVTIDGVDISSRFDEVDLRVANIRTATTPYVSYYKLADGGWGGESESTGVPIVVAQVHVPQGILRGFEIYVEDPFLTSGSVAITGDVTHVRILPLGGVDADADGVILSSERYPPSGLSCSYSYNQANGSFATANTIQLGQKGTGQRQCHVEIEEGGAYIQIVAINPPDAPQSGSFLFTVLMDQATSFDSSTYTGLFDEDFGALSPLDAPPNTFTTGGDADWLATGVESDGTIGYASPTAALGSGDVGSNQTSWLDYNAGTLATNDVISFQWATSSEEEKDFLSFVVVDPDSVSHTVLQISGFVDKEAPFHKVQYVVQQPGAYHFRWVYTKDNLLSLGTDRGYLDDVKVWQSPTVVTQQNIVEISSYALTTIYGTNLTRATVNGTYTQSGYGSRYTDHWASPGQPNNRGLVVHLFPAYFSYSSYTTDSNFKLTVYGKLGSALTFKGVNYSAGDVFKSETIFPSYNQLGWTGLNYARHWKFNYTGGYFISDHADALDWYANGTWSAGTWPSGYTFQASGANVTGNQVLWDAIYAIEWTDAATGLPLEQQAGYRVSDPFIIAADDNSGVAKTGSQTTLYSDVVMNFHNGGPATSIGLRPTAPTTPANAKGTLFDGPITVGGDNKITLSGDTSVGTAWGIGASPSADTEILIIGKSTATPPVDQYEIVTIPNSGGGGTAAAFSVTTTKTWSSIDGIASGLVPPGATIAVGGVLTATVNTDVVAATSVNLATVINIGSDYATWDLDVSDVPNTGVKFTANNTTASEPDVTIPITANDDYSATLTAETSGNVTVAGTTITFTVSGL